MNTSSFCKTSSIAKADARTAVSNLSAMAEQQEGEPFLHPTNMKQRMECVAIILRSITFSRSCHSFLMIPLFFYSLIVVEFSSEGTVIKTEKNTGNNETWELTTLQKETLPI